MNTPTIHDTGRLAALAARAGSHFFSESALRFFSSRVHAPVYGNRYFVTSEQDRGSYDGRYPAQPRLYTVREFAWTNKGSIVLNTVGPFQGYPTRDSAHAVARRLGDENARIFGGYPFPTPDSVIERAGGVTE